MSVLDPVQGVALRRRKVVVGVDGSAASRDALRWAADYAAAVAGDLDVWTAWQWPSAMLAMGGVPAPEGYDPESDAAAELSSTLAAVLGNARQVSLTTHVVMGPAARALMDAAATADLLVVGSRGHGAVTDVLLGSTSETCARHAPCPVVIVRHQPGPAVAESLSEQEISV